MFFFARRVKDMMAIIVSVSLNQHADVIVHLYNHLVNHVSRNPFWSPILSLPRSMLSINTRLIILPVMISNHVYITVFSSLRALRAKCDFI